MRYFFMCRDVMCGIVNIPKMFPGIWVRDIRLVQLRSAVTHRLQWIEDGRQYLILNLYQLQRLLRNGR